MVAGGEHHDSIAAPPLLAAAVLLGLLCTALYANTGASEFVGDDASAVVENPAVRWRELTLGHMREALALEQPVTALSYGLNYRVGRLDVHGYHGVNTAIHFANALLVFALARALFARIAATAKTSLSAEAAPWAALAAAGLFAAHPLQVEAVTWIARRGVLLAALFGLAAALCWLRGRAEPRARAAWWSAAGALWLIALGSHEAALAVPVAIGLCEWLSGARSDRAAGPARLARLAGVLLATAVAWITVRHAPALALYESLLVWPLPGRLSLVHDVGGSVLARGGAVALQLALLGAAFALARRHRVASFALLWFFAVHAVEAAFGAPGPAEHRNYFALIGPALAAGHGLFAMLPRRLGLATAVSVVAAAALGAGTHARNEQWRSPEALWDAAVNASPRDAAARLERGALRERRGDTGGALEDFAEAVQLAPDSADARERLAASLASVGQWREALPHAREAVARDPESAPAHAALGRILASLGELEPAAAELARALELGGDGSLERNLGDTLVRLGRFEESLSHYRAAIERDPGDDDARTGMGAALVELARAREALAYLEPAVESQPNPRYLAHFADALWQLGDVGGALDAAAMAVRVGRAWPGAASRLAWMLALCPDPARRDPARALRIAEIALSQAGAPDAQLLDARAAALAAAGRFADAHAEAERAASAASDPALAASITAHARSYARRELVRDPPRPFEPSP